MTNHSMRDAHRRARFQVLFGLLFTVGVLVGVLYFSGISSIGGKNYRVTAFVTNARGIAQDSSVVIAGLPVGEVTGISRKGPDAVLTMKLNSGPVPLPADSTVQMRLRSLAGETYVQIFPGKSKVTVPNGGSLGLSQNQSYTEVDEILNELNGKTEYTTRELVQGLGAAVKDNGTNLNQLVGHLSSLIIDSAPLTATLAHQNQQAADVVQYLGDVMDDIGQRTSALTDFATGATATFDAVGDRDKKLNQVLKALPDTLTSVRQAANSIQATSPHITPVLDNLSSAVRDLSPAVRYLEPASTQGITLVSNLGSANPQLRGILTDVNKLAPSTTAALPQVYDTLCQLNPIVSYFAPYGNDLGAFFQNFSDTANLYEQYGHEFPASLNVNPDNIIPGLTKTPTDLQGPLDTLLNTGILHQLQSTTGFDADPPPGGQKDHTKGVGLKTPTEFGQHFTYPHVTANCS